MSWLTEQRLGTRRLESWIRARLHIETLARFHGYVPDGFKWQDSKAVWCELKLKMADDAAAMALDTNGPTVSISSPAAGLCGNQPSDSGQVRADLCTE